MRIAMISEHASPLAKLGGVDSGGQNLHVADLSTALAELGHEVRVYTRRDAEDQPVTQSMGAGVSVVQVPAGPAKYVPKDLLLPHMKEFGDWVGDHWRGDNWQPDVTHAHFWMSGLAAIAASRPIGVPVVQTYHALGSVKRRHQGANDTSPRLRIGYERALGGAVDRVVAQCQDEVRELIRLGVPRTRISLIPSGVDADRFHPDGPAEPRDQDRPRVLSVGRMVERKGFADVIRAMRIVPSAECVIVGGPPPSELGRDPMVKGLQALASRCGVADRVRLVGAVPREEMPRWYRSADVLASAAWYEPFGLTPLEAMACGVPVVGSAVGGLLDTVVDGLTGTLVPPRDPRALGKALRRLVDDRVRRLAYGTAALDRSRSCYSWRRAATQLSSVYSSLCRLRRPTGAVA
jgi:glycosyltransferase involved in cell wall biosynthesis